MEETNKEVMNGEEVTVPVEESAENETLAEAENVEEFAEDVEGSNSGAEEKPAAADNAEVDVDALVAKKASRFTHEIAKASKNTRKEMYRSEHVITEYGDEEVETNSTKMRADYLELVASAKSQKILKGKLMGYRYAGEPRKSTVLAEIEYGSGLFTVLIPSYLLYDYDESRYVDHDKIQVIENDVLRRIGSTVRFIVRHIEEKTQTVLADRLLAQSIVAHDNYIRPTRDGRPRVINGMIVKGQVIRVLSKGIVVDCLGCDIKIPKEELSHSYVGDARAEFQVGDDVNVRVTDISEKTVEKNGTNYRLITATGSVKDAMPNQKKKLFDQIKIDGVYAATITYVEEAGVFCRLRGGADCLCALPRFGQNPKRGQTRTVKITDKVEDNLFIYGVFVNN